MGKRYYCEYCDRSFVDDIQTRKKHLQGSAHIRSYKQHYQKYRDLKTLIADEEMKEECKKFLNTGYCAFQDSCYRSHYTRQQLVMFRNQLEMEERHRMIRDVDELKTLDSWLQKRNSDMLPFVDSSENLTASIAPSNYFHSNYYSYIPPSLQSIRITRPFDIETAQWG